MLYSSREQECHCLKGFHRERSFLLASRYLVYCDFSRRKRVGEVFKYSKKILSMKGTWYTDGMGLYSSIQIPSGYYLQTMNSNLHFSGFVLPVAAMNVISIVPLLILVPILECINSCLFSSKDAGHSPTIYIGMYKIYVFIQFLYIFCFWKRNCSRWWMILHNYFWL